MNEFQQKENTVFISEDYPFNLFHFTTSSSEVLYTHWHDHIEIILDIRGNSLFIIDGKRFVSKPGDIIFVSKNQLHSAFSNIDEKVSEISAIVICRSMLTNFFDKKNKYTDVFLQLLNGDYSCPLIVSEKDKDYSDFISTYYKAVNEYNKKQSNYEFLLFTYITELLVLFSRRIFHTNTSVANYNIKKEHLDYIKYVITYISNHYMVRITIDSISELVHVSPYYFCKIFKKATGRTFVDYLNSYRINEALELLKNTNFSIDIIAEKTGFCNVNYFYRIYSKYVNISPNKYRKEFSVTN